VGNHKLISMIDLSSVRGNKSVHRATSENIIENLNVYNQSR